MNVFVLNTGRCGSTTFVEACKHITNFSSGHETRKMLLGDERFQYPQNHIEADNRLSWVLGRLDRHYGDNAFYVHLTRNDEDTAQSFVNRFSSGIIFAYRTYILQYLPKSSDAMSIAVDYCDTVNSNIRLFLRDKSHSMSISLENIQDDFPDFWKKIGAEGDIDKALSEFTRKHNATGRAGPAGSRKVGLAVRIYQKVVRIFKGLPTFISEA